MKKHRNLHGISSLDAILRSYEETDYILFDPVTLPKASDKKPNSNSRKSRKDSQLTNSVLHSNPKKPLGSLPEDEESRILLNRVNDLEHQQLDLSSQIELAQQSIAQLERQLAEITNNDMKKSIRPISTYQKTARQILHSPDIRRSRQPTPNDMTPEQSEMHYKDLYHRVRNQLDQLKLVLETKESGPAPLLSKGMKPGRRPR
ncbi:hypothetical protein M9Y10_028513 [Tritrichomonas musculus]|uniref:Uncharacterized protein n=1 Tax=Tritrichomonas musculus TaxID=1915356 RepID=A0ABR2KMU7_9EUKA